MYYMYVLKTGSEKNSFYIGSTDDLKRRLGEHLRGKVCTTKRLGLPRLVYYEAYLDRELARERERQLKRFGSAYNALLKRLGIK